MKILYGIAGTVACAFLLGAAEPSTMGNVFAGRTGGGMILQIDPGTEELDQVSEPVGEVSEEPDDVPSETLDEDSETDDQASEEVGDDIAPTEELDQASETDDQASEEVGADSETAEQASEVLPAGPGGEEYPLEESPPAQEQMPLGDREAEGRDLPQ